MDVRTTRKGLLQRLSLVWLVPLLALAISLGVAWQNYANQGTLIEIDFDDANGIVAGETVIKYRDVEIGKVEKVNFAEGLVVVVVEARVDKDIAPFLDADAQFWVVRPNVSLRGVTGLDTVLSGVYIEANFNTEADVEQSRFVALKDAPLVRANQQGTQIVLRARDGSSLASGAPILHKGIQVGYLETPQLARDGNSVTVNAFVEAPFNRNITTATRFWNTSGFSLSLGASGVSLNVSSLASLIEGGIAYDTVVSGGTPVRDGQVFDIFDDEVTARNSLFSDPNKPVLDVAVLFDGSVSGLTKGSEVRFQGIRVGQVAELNAVVVENENTNRVQLRTVLEIEPGRLGLGEEATPEEALTFLADFVRQGLRARLITGNILSGSLVVELIEVPDVPAAFVDLTAKPYPVIPTTASAITDVADQAGGVLDRINNLPIEELMQSAIDVMNSVERLANEDSLRNAPASLTALLDETRALIASPDIAAIPGDVRKTIADLNAIVAQAGEADLVGKLTTAIESASGAAASIDTASANLPQITAQLEELAGKANDLDLAGLVNEATATLDSIDKLVGSQSTQDLPASLSAALDEVRVFLSEVRQGGAIENVNAALASANEAARAIENAAASLPQLAERATALVTETQSVLDNYGERGRFNAETLATLRDIQDAADAVSSLARAIQRNPNSLLTGR
jgi:paraquat-inducible protein B